MKCKIIATGEIIKGVIVNCDRTIQDVKTGKYYHSYEYEAVVTPSIRSIGLTLGSISIYLYFHEWIKYKEWYIPGLSISYNSGFGSFMDLEIKLLYFGFGLRFAFWPKKRRKK